MERAVFPDVETVKKELLDAKGKRGRGELGMESAWNGLSGSCGWQMYMFHAMVDDVARERHRWIKNWAYTKLEDGREEAKCFGDPLVIWSADSAGNVASMITMNMGQLEELASGIDVVVNCIDDEVPGETCRFETYKPHKRFIDSRLNFGRLVWKQFNGGLLLDNIGEPVSAQKLLNKKFIAPGHGSNVVSILRGLVEEHERAKKALDFLYREYFAVDVPL